MDFDPCQSGHDLFHLKNSYLSFYLAMKMRLGVTKRRLFGSWLVISAIWVAGVGYRTWRGCRVWCTSQRDRCFRLILEEEIVYHNRHFYRV